MTGTELSHQRCLVFLVPTKEEDVSRLERPVRKNLSYGVVIDSTGLAGAVVGRGEPSFLFAPSLGLV
jgi:hypothetical protein